MTLISEAADPFASWKNIPELMTALPQWAVQGDDKMPINPNTGLNASCDEDSSWSDFETACAVVREGRYDATTLAFVLTAADNLAVIDEDYLKDGKTWRVEGLTVFDSYTEWSPGRGSHTWITVDASSLTDWERQGHQNRKLRREAYFAKKFMSVTGEAHASSPALIYDRTEQYKEYLPMYFSQPGTVSGDDEAPIGTGPEPMEDEQVLELCNGKEKFRKLFDGDTSGYASKSEADMGMAGKLWYFTRDKAQIRRLMERSGLNHPKWQENRGYLDTTLSKLDPRRPYYMPSYELHDIVGLDDFGNADRFVELIKGGAVYVAERGEWLLNNGTRWLRDRTNRIRRLARSSLDKLLLAAEDEIAKAEDTQDKQLIKRAQGYLTFAKRSRRAESIRSILFQAPSYDGVGIVPERLDPHPLKFNMRNGTLDFSIDDTARVLQPHNPDDYITQLAPVSYDPNARSDALDRFMDEMYGDTVEFIFQLAGYSLTGMTNAETVPFIHGPARAGKSTLMGIMQSAWGDYCVNTSYKTLLENKRSSSSSPNPALVRLEKARLVFANEFPDGAILDTALLKSLTDGRISARDCFKSQVEFDIIFKLWLISNYPPIIAAGDDAAKRRVVRIEARNAISEGKEDRSLKARLMTDPQVLSAFVARAVRSCLHIKRNNWRFDVPESVKLSTAHYWQEMDPLHDFVTIACDKRVGDKDCYSVRSELYRDFVYNCHQNGWKTVNRVDFIRLLREVHKIEAPSNSPKKLKGVNDHKSFHPLIGIKIKEEFKAPSAWRDPEQQYGGQS